MKAPSRRPGRPPKDIGRASARGALLDSAHALMTERDTIDVPVADIARHAGLSVALVSYYFGGKDALCLALALRYQADQEAALQRLLELPAKAEVKLRLHIRAMVEEFRRVPYLQRLNHKILREGNEEAARACAIALVQPLAGFYRALIAQGELEGRFRYADPMHLYFSLVGACEFLFSGSASLKYGFGIQSVTDELANAYVEYLTTVVARGLLLPT